ncbi:hypothetical protein F4776DRAFT_669584 [Hypoxylon sp. NC0597]|nr:hypothetical protein F4776DRAFT_669584 [Hypoxylon sp. NC0597]
MDDGSPSTPKGKGKGKAKADPPKSKPTPKSTTKGKSKNDGMPEISQEDLYNQKYTLDQPIRDVITAAGKKLPIWYPKDIPQEYTFHKWTFNAEATPEAVRQHEREWSAFNRDMSVTKPVVRLIGREPFSRQSQCAAYLGFGGGNGVDLFTYWIDNEAPQVLGPMRSWMKTQDAVTYSSHLTSSVWFNTVRELSDNAHTSSNLSEWTNKVLEDDNYYGLPAGVTSTRKAAFSYALTAGVLRLFKVFPGIFVETYDNPQNPDKDQLTQYFLRHSGEDWNRGNAAYKSLDEERRENAQDLAHIVCNEFLFSTDEMHEAFERAGMTDAFKDEEWEKYRELNEEEQREYIYEQATAISNFRVRSYHNTSKSTFIKKMPFMTAEEQEQLCEWLKRCYVSLETGNGRTHHLDDGFSQEHRDAIISSIENATFKDTVFIPNDTLDPNEPDPCDPAAGEREILEEKQKAGLRLSDNNVGDEEADAIESQARQLQKNIKEDFINNLDEMCGGNDTNEMTVEEACKRTGWDWKDSRVDRTKEDSLRLRPHQIVDIAQVVEKLDQFPHTCILADACGTGKTVMNMGAVDVIRLDKLEMLAKQIEDVQSDEDREVYYPSIYMCPANVISTTFAECVASFPGRLLPKVYYGDSHEYSAQPSVQQAMIGPQDLQKFFASLRPDDPNTAKVLIITSYVTFKRRATTSIKVPASELTYEDRVFCALHLLDDPSNTDFIDNAPQEDEVDHVDLAEKNLYVPKRKSFKRSARKDKAPKTTSNESPPTDQPAEEPRHAEHPQKPDDPEDDPMEDIEIDDTDKALAAMLQEENEPIPEDQREWELQDIERALRPRTPRPYGPDGNPDDQEESETEDKKTARTQNAFHIVKPKFDQKFELVICDEAHLLKNRSSSIHKAVKCLDRKRLLLCTATPMLNDTMDVLSYALLAWPKARPSRVPRDFSYDSLYGPGSDIIDYKHTDNPCERYFSDLGNPSVSTLLQDVDGNIKDLKARIKSDPDGLSLRGPLVDPDWDGKADPDTFDDLLRSAESGRKPWKLNPVNLYWASRYHRQSFDASRKIVRDFLAHICVKRGMQTKLKLPDGTVVTPGDDIKGAIFSIHNVRHVPRDQRRLDELWEEWHPQLYSPDSESDKKGDTPRGKGLGGRPPKPAAKTGRINMRAFRHLLLPAFDLRNDKLLQPSKDLAALVAKIHADEADIRLSTNISKLENDSAIQTGGQFVHTARLGSNQAYSLATGFDDGGAGWLFETLKPSESLSVPGSRIAFIRWLVYQSPIMARVIIQVHEWMKQPIGPDRLPNRVVIMAVMPWVQQDLVLCLDMFGWNVASIRSDHTMHERNRMVADFNNPDSQVDILVTSMELSAFGLNLHKACNKGIVVQWPWSANHLIQILGRLPRIGQARVVEWIIFTVPGTMYDRMETIVWSKYIRQLAVESKISEMVHGVLAEIAGYSILYNMFDMPHHRYLWDRNAWYLDSRTTIDKKMRPQRLSMFYRELGQFILNIDSGALSDQDRTAFSDLTGRSKEDILAGAVIWLRHHDLVSDEGGKAEYPELTWTWLADNCLMANIVPKLRNKWMSRYLPDQILDALSPQPPESRGRPTHDKAELSRKKLKQLTGAKSYDSDDSDMPNADSEDSDADKAFPTPSRSHGGTRKRDRQLSDTVQDSVVKRNKLDQVPTDPTSEQSETSHNDTDGNTYSGDAVATSSQDYSRLSETEAVEHMARQMG